MHLGISVSKGLAVLDCTVHGSGIARIRTRYRLAVTERVCGGSAVAPYLGS